jgi:Domain of unknown function (DUF5666)
MSYVDWKLHMRNRALAVLLCTAFMGCVEPETKVTTSGSGKTAPEKMVASGVITGLGPIQVGGTTLADGNAQALLNAAANRSANDLRLGMTSDITGTITNSTGLGDASTIVTQSAVRGRISFINQATQQLSVQGLLIGFDHNTIFDNTTGSLGGVRAGSNAASALSGLNIGDTVEIYAVNTRTPITSSNVLATHMLATRVTLLAASTDTNVELFGTVAAGVSTNSRFITLAGNIINAANALQLGVANASTSAVTVPTAIPAGSRIRVVGFVDPGIDEIVATHVISNITTKKSDDEIIILDAIVNGLSTATRVRMGDSEVDLSATNIASSVTPGVRLQVRGRRVGGVVQASNARVIGNAERIEYVVDGAITDVAGSLIRVRGEWLNVATANFSGGTAANLAVGRQVLVKGFAGPGHLLASSVGIK